MQKNPGLSMTFLLEDEQKAIMKTFLIKIDDNNLSLSYDQNR